MVAERLWRINSDAIPVLSHFFFKTRYALLPSPTFYSRLSTSYRPSPHDPSSISPPLLDASQLPGERTYSYKVSSAVSLDD